MSEVVPASDLPSSNVVPQGDLPVTTTSRAARPSLLNQATAPIRNIPSDIGSEFSAGMKEAGEGFDQQQEGARRGDVIQRDLGSLKYLMGGLREFFSPISGTAKAIAGDPIRAIVPGKGGEILARTTELGASAIGPGAVGKSLEALTNVMPAYKGAVKTLMDAGVQLTPGQITQGAFKGFEHAISRVPVAGSFLRAGEINSLEGFNRAVTDKSLESIGEQLPKNVKAGREAINYAEDKIAEKYDQILPKVNLVPDIQLQTDMQAISARNNTRLPEQQLRQYDRIVSDFSGRMGANGMSGQTYKRSEAELNYLSRQYAKSPDTAQRELGYSINQFRSALKENLVRSNPKYAGQLQDIDTAWAAFTRVRDASIRAQPNGEMEIGIFSPSDLWQTVKASTPKGAFARGDGMLQKLADAGMQVLPAKVPQMTPGERLGWAFLIGTGGEYIDPLAMVPLAVGTGAAYSKPGIAAANALTRAVPEAAKVSQQPISSLLPLAGQMPVNQNQ